MTHPSESMSSSKLQAVIDCDVHYRWQSIEQIAPYVKEPWRSRLLRGASVYPNNTYFNVAGIRRRDAVPPDGGSPGSDPHFLIADLVDAYSMDYIILNGEAGHLGVSNLPNSDWASTLASAYNDWLINDWLTIDQRFLGSIIVATQDPQQAAREIDRIAGHPQLVQVLLGAGARFPYGQRHYYPIYEAAERNGLPIAIHPGTEGPGISNPPTAVGYPSYYIEWHTCLTTAFQAHLVSLICEGVFERFQELRFVFLEGGVSWLPPLLWRLDKNYKGLRSEVPWLKKCPSAYAEEHLMLSTQPIEEPPQSHQLNQILEMFPAEKMLMYSSDYPHWDFDDPRAIFRHFSSGFRGRVFSENARQFYGLK